MICRYAFITDDLASYSLPLLHSISIHCRYRVIFSKKLIFWPLILPTSGFCLISPGFFVSNLRSMYTCYTIILLIVPITSEDVAETQGSSVKDELMKLVRMSWKVLLPCRLLWMVSVQMACHHLAIPAYVICFLFHLVSDCFLLMALY